MTGSISASREGRYSLQVYGPSNKVVAGIGQSKAGNGIILIGDGAGTTKVSMKVK